MHSPTLYCSEHHARYCCEQTLALVPPHETGARLKSVLGHKLWGNVMPGGAVVAHWERKVHCMQGMLLHVVAVLSGSTAAVMVFALQLIIQPRPWWSAQYMIAILGLLLSSSLSCVAAGLSSTIDELTRGKCMLPHVCSEVFVYVLYLAGLSVWP